MPRKKKTIKASPDCELHEAVADLTTEITHLDVRIRSLSNTVRRLEFRIHDLENPPKATPWYLRKVF